METKHQTIRTPHVTYQTYHEYNHPSLMMTEHSPLLLGNNRRINNTHNIMTVLTFALIKASRKRCSSLENDFVTLVKASFIAKDEETLVDSLNVDELDTDVTVQALTTATSLDMTRLQTRKKYFICSRRYYFTQRMDNKLDSFYWNVQCTTRCCDKA